MGFSTHYFKDHDFMLTNISGDITDNDLMQHIIAYDKETEKLLIRKELSDCRKIQSITSLSTQAATSAADIQQAKMASKLAILIPKGNDAIYGMARAYQTFAEGKRDAVNIFRDFEEALMWLADGNIEEKESLVSFIKRI